MSEKGSQSHVESAEKGSLEETGAPLKGAALAYGGDDTLPPPPTLTPEEEKKLWRKIDMKLMPILTLMYLCSFVDRSNIGTHDLHCCPDGSCAGHTHTAPVLQGTQSCRD